MDAFAAQGVKVPLPNHSRDRMAKSSVPPWTLAQPYPTLAPWKRQEGQAKGSKEADSQTAIAGNTLPPWKREKEEEEEEEEEEQEEGESRLAVGRRKKGKGVGSVPTAIIGSVNTAMAVPPPATPKAPRRAERKRPRQQSPKNNKSVKDNNPKPKVKRKVTGVRLDWKGRRVTRYRISKTRRVSRHPRAGTVKEEDEEKGPSPSGDTERASKSDSEKSGRLDKRRSEASADEKAERSCSPTSVEPVLKSNGRADRSYY